MIFIEFVIVLLIIFFYYYSSKLFVLKYECNLKVVFVVLINGMENLQKDDSCQVYLEVVNEVEKCLIGEVLGELSFE